MAEDCPGEVSGTIYPQKLAITLPRKGSRSVGIVRSRTQTMEFVFFVRVKPWQHRADELTTVC
jgi:hypothetical protein